MPSVWEPHDLLVKSLVAAVPDILKSQDATGRFGDKPWICQDQHRIYPLAAAWAVADPGNPYHRSPEILKAIIAGGDALIEEADEEGMWTFRKKDHSTWGQIFMPWTYSRWIRAFLLVREAMPAERRARWEKALLKGYEGISKTCLDHVHNIPCHHAMGLYAAGIAFDRDDWKKQAGDFMGKVMARQHRDGYWSEHSGPVVTYNFVYSESLGVYYAMSKDAAVLEALRRAAAFHANFTYPDGSAVETIDERNWYHEGVNLGNVGFSFTPEGRGYLARQTALFLGANKPFPGEGAGARPGWGRPAISESAWNEKVLDADPAATFLLYGQTGPGVPMAGERDEFVFVLGGSDASILRTKPWFACASAFACEPPRNRWIQDRQNFLSIFHDDLGLFCGGGNTKLQPLLSTFTVGDVSLLRHAPGDEDPEFLPKIDLSWYPSKARLLRDDSSTGVELTYGEETCTIRAAIADARRLAITLEATCWSGRPIEGHIPFLCGLAIAQSPGNRPSARYRRDDLPPAIRSASGKEALLAAEAFQWTSAEAGGSVRCGGLEIAMPEGSRLVWPALLHDPYKKDGASDCKSGRLVLCVPLSAARKSARVDLRVLDSAGRT